MRTVCVCVCALSRYSISKLWFYMQLILLHANSDMCQLKQFEQLTRMTKLHNISEIFITHPHQEQHLQKGVVHQR